MPLSTTTAHLDAPPSTLPRLGSFNSYLDTVQRQRRYFSELRPAHRKLATGTMWLARAPTRRSIFDPDKLFDDGANLPDGPAPEPPRLSLSSADEHSVSVFWRYSIVRTADEETRDSAAAGAVSATPAASSPKAAQVGASTDARTDARHLPAMVDSAGVEAFAFEVQAAIHDVVWEGEQFFEGFRPFETVYRGGTMSCEATVHGLRSDTKVRLRIRARGEFGYGEWYETDVATQPVGSKRADELPLPRSWLLVDVADIVPLHMAAIGGLVWQSKAFFLEIATALTPHVRRIRRLFTGWSRATSVGRIGSASKGELSRQQFMRLTKEVGLCVDSGASAKRAAARSGARLLSMDDVDRIFQRSNYDASDGSRGTGSRRGSIDRTQIAMSAEEALDELSRTGWFLETDPGETNLREKL